MSPRVVEKPKRSFLEGHAKKKLIKNLALIDYGWKKGGMIGESHQEAGAHTVSKLVKKIPDGLGEHFETALRLAERGVTNRAHDKLLGAIHNHISKFKIDPRLTKDILNEAVMGSPMHAEIMNVIAQSKGNRLEDSHIDTILKSANNIDRTLDALKDPMVSHIKRAPIDKLTESLAYHSNIDGLGKHTDKVIDTLESLKKNHVEMLESEKKYDPAGRNIADRTDSLSLALVLHEKKNDLTPEQAKRISQIVEDVVPSSVNGGLFLGKNAYNLKTLLKSKY